MHYAADFSLVDLLDRSGVYSRDQEALAESTGDPFIESLDTCKETSASEAIRSTLAHFDISQQFRIRVEHRDRPRELLRRLDMFLMSHPLDKSDAKDLLQALTTMVMAASPNAPREQALDFLEFAIRRLLGKWP